MLLRRRRIEVQVATGDEPPVRKKVRVYVVHTHANQPGHGGGGAEPPRWGLHLSGRVDPDNTLDWQASMHAAALAAVQSGGATSAAMEAAQRVAKQAGAHPFTSLWRRVTVTIRYHGAQQQQQQQQQGGGGGGGGGGGAEEEEVVVWEKARHRGPHKLWRIGSRPASVLIRLEPDNSPPRFRRGPVAPPSGRRARPRRLGAAAGSGPCRGGGGRPAAATPGMLAWPARCERGCHLAPCRAERGQGPAGQQRAREPQDPAARATATPAPAPARTTRVPARAPRSPPCFGRQAAAPAAADRRQPLRDAAGRRQGDRGRAGPLPGGSGPPAAGPSPGPYCGRQGRRLRGAAVFSPLFLSRGPGQARRLRRRPPPRRSPDPYSGGRAFPGPQVPSTPAPSAPNPASQNLNPKRARHNNLTSQAPGKPGKYSAPPIVAAALGLAPGAEVDRGDVIALAATAMEPAPPVEIRHEVE
jgi:hypothetical protein